MKFDRIVEVALAAQRLGEPGPLSTGEALTAALVLNRHDWLRAMGYTIAEALEDIRILKQGEAANGQPIALG